MDVDGSYLWRKQQQLKESGVLASISATITVLPSPPLSGWVTINESNYKEICLRRNHIYFAQIQDQMAVGLRPWCDFVVYTTVCKEFNLTMIIGTMSCCLNLLTSMKLYSS